MVAITHMSNMLGTLVPVKEVVRLANARGIPVLVDGSQAAVHLEVDVQDIGCDFYVFTGHKLYGPSGIGILWGKHDHLADDAAVQRRRRDDPRVSRPTRSPMASRRTASRPERRRSSRRSGSAPRSTMCSRSARRGSRAHEADLVAYAHERLREINSMRIFGHAKDKGPIVSFEMKGAHPHDVATVIDRSGVAVRAGTHCVMPLLQRYGVTRDLPRLVRPLQHARGGRCPRQGADQGAGYVRMSDENPSQMTRVSSHDRDHRTGGGARAEAARRFPQEELARLTDDIVAALKTVYDPEIPADIYELGLIYRVDVEDDRSVKVDMTLTTPNCPAAAELPLMVENAVASVPGVGGVNVAVVWDPPWDPSRMSDEARLVLNMW